MPVMDGFETTLEIQKLFDSGLVKKVPIIALTASDDKETVKHCYDVGMKGVLTKPIVASKFFALINKEKKRRVIS